MTLSERDSLNAVGTPELIGRLKLAEQIISDGIVEGVLIHQLAEIVRQREVLEGVIEDRTRPENRPKIKKPDHIILEPRFWRQIGG